MYKWSSAPIIPTLGTYTKSIYLMHQLSDPTVTIVLLGDRWVVLLVHMRIEMLKAGLTFDFDRHTDCWIELDGYTEQLFCVDGEALHAQLATDIVALAKDESDLTEKKALLEEASGYLELADDHRAKKDNWWHVRSLIAQECERLLKETQTMLIQQHPETPANNEADSNPRFFTLAPDYNSNQVPGGLSSNDPDSDPSQASKETQATAPDTSGP